MTREFAAAHHGSGGRAGWPGDLHRVIARTPRRQVRDLGATGLTSSASAAADHNGAMAVTDGLADRRRLFGRLAATFYVAADALGLATLPLPAPGSQPAVTGKVYAAALAPGIGIWFAPWGRWPRSATLVIVPPAFALIALGNTFGGEDQHTYGVFFVVAFVWIGIAAKARTILGDRVRVVPAIGGATLTADRQRLTQALLNLLQNAADHAKGDKPVSLRAGAESSSWRFEVADGGGGLPPGDEHVVFEPFSTGSSQRGVGLGLPIVRGIARAHGGEAGVVNQPGQGATFWIRVPR